MASAKRGGIVGRHQQRIDAGARDFAAAGNVGRDNGAPAGGRFQQAFRQAFPPRRQHRDMRPRPDRRDVFDKAEHLDARPRFPAFDFAPSIEAGLAGSRSPAISSRMASPRCVRRSCASTSVRTPLSSSRRPTKPAVTGPAGSGSGLRRSVSTPEPGTVKIRSGDNAERRHRRAVVRILHEHSRLRAFEKKPQQRRQNRTDDLRLQRRRRESETKTGQRIQPRKRHPERGQRADDGRLQRDVMHEIGLQLPIQRPHLPDDAERDRAD